jgi:hypothetical protein
MERAVSRVWSVTAVGLAMGLSLASGGTLLARQDPPAQQAAAPAPQDNLKLPNSPHLIIWGVKPSKAADFEALWLGLQAQFEKSDKPEVKEFGATITNMYKLNAPGQPADRPVIFVFQVEKPSQTQSYNPGMIIYQFLYKQVDGKEVGIPRAEADELFKKIGTQLTDMFDSINTWPLTKIGS